MKTHVWSSQNLYFFVIILISSVANQLHGLSVKILSEKDLNNFLVTEEYVTHTGTDAFIRKVSDGNTIYILKQINNPSIDEQFLLINDCIASTIGWAAGIHVNQVFFIPYNVGCHLKTYPDRAATLHAYILGNDLESNFPKFFPADFTLHQRIINLNSLWQKKYPLAENQQSLSKSLIESMAFHEDLPALVALDTFIGNADRGLPNIFYHQHNNCFYGIDQAAAFSRTLSLCAFEQLRKLASEDYFDNCVPKVIDSLGIYHGILLRLYEVTQPSIIIQSMHELTAYLDVNALQSTEIIARMRHHSFIIEQNYRYSLKLITLLDQILSN